MIQFAALGVAFTLLVFIMDLLGVEPLDTISVISVALPAVAWWAWWLWWRVSRMSPSPLSRERALVAQRDALVATLVGWIGLRRIIELPVPGELTTLLLVVALLAICLYPIRLLVWYYRGDFERQK